MVVVVVVVVAVVVVVVVVVPVSGGSSSSGGSTAQGEEERNPQSSVGLSDVCVCVRACERACVCEGVGVWRVNVLICERGSLEQPTTVKRTKKEKNNPQ